MEWEEIETELAALAEKLDIEVRHVRYEGEGGLCVLRGKRVLMVNDALAAADRAGIMAQALATIPEVQDVYVAPEVRRLLDRHASEGANG